MNRQTIFQTILIMIFFGFFWASCEGPEGPMGPHGDQGLQGEQGITGEQGPAGEDGNANIYYSDWLAADFTFISFIGEKDETSGRGEMLIPEPKITKDFLNDGGTILMFMKAELPEHDAIIVYSLPFDFDGVKLIFVSMVNTPWYGGRPFTGLALEMSSAIPGEPLSKSIIDNMNDQGFEFRYILIPGGTSLAGKGAVQDLEWDEMDYETITTLFGIPE